MQKTHHLSSIFPKHGGSIAEIEAVFGRPTHDWIDLSTGITPYPYPLPRLADSVWQRLPQPSQITATVAAARSYYQAPEDAGIVAAAGSQAVIQMLPRLIAPTSVAIVGPTYCEHQYCWAMTGHHTVVFHDPQSVDSLIHDFQIIIVTNPNNPTGRIIDADILVWVTKRMTEKGGLLVVDEAFADTDPRCSMSPYGGQTSLVILRSFGKFFGLAGLRLGFAITTQDLAQRLQSALGPWAVSGPALAIAQHAYQDEQWIQNTRKHLHTTADRLDRLLSEHTLSVIGGTTLFRLIQTSTADRLFTRSCYAGILLRRFAEYPTWLRIGLPPNVAAFDRLAAVIAMKKTKDNNEAPITLRTKNN